MPFNVGLVDILLILFPLAIVGGAVYLVARYFIGAAAGREPGRLEHDPHVMRELEDVQGRLLDLEERMDSAERLFADQKQQQQIPRQ